MSSEFQVDPSRRTILGIPLHPLEEGEVLLVEGALGNPVWLNDDDLFLPEDAQQQRPEKTREFYLLCAARRGQSVEEVAARLQKEHRLWIHPFQPAGEPATAQGPTDTFTLEVVPERSRHYLDREIRGKLRFFPEVSHLRAIYGEKADYFMVAVRLPNRREAVFGTEYRRRDVQGRERAENLNVRKFDLIQSSLDGVTEVMRRGGFALFDRQDPEGKATDPFYVATMSDLHLSRQTDQLEQEIIRRRDERLFLRFNNANANFLEAEIPWINQEFEQGRLDTVILLGDNIDFDGNSHETSHNLPDSNNELLARALDRIKAPVFVTAGNHDQVPEEFPAELNAANYNLSFMETASLTWPLDPTSVDIPILGLPLTPVWKLLKRTGKAFNAIIPDPSTMISFYDVINPFPNLAIDLGIGDPNSLGSRPARLVLMDMGPADPAHFRQDDPIYRELEWWPWQWPFTHLGSAGDLLFQASPDLRGPTIAQLSWLAYQLSHTAAHAALFTHSPLLNSKLSQVPFDPKAKVTQLVPAGSYEDLFFNTTTHGTQMLRVLADSPFLRLHVGGHTHFDGNAYAIGLDYQGNPQVYRGPIREALAQLDGKDQKAVRDFWMPEEGPSNGHPSSVSLHGDLARDLRSFKATWQVGAAGISSSYRSPPVFSRLVIGPAGLVTAEEHLYVYKDFKPHPSDRSRWVVTREVSTKPPPQPNLKEPEKNRHPNDLLWEGWARDKKADPRRVLDWEGALERAQGRLSQRDISFAPRPDSYNENPRYNDVVDHPVMSTFETDPRHRIQVGLTPFQDGRWFELTYQRIHGEKETVLISRQLLEGWEAGLVGRPTRPTAHLALRTNTLVDMPFSLFGEPFAARAVALSLGISAEVSDDPVGFFNRFRILETASVRKGFNGHLTLELENPFRGVAALLVGLGFELGL